MTLILTNSVDLIVNSLSLIQLNHIEDISDIFLSKDEAISGIVGLPPTTLNTLEKIGASIDNDPNFFANNQSSLNQKSDLTYVNGELTLKKDIASYTIEKVIITNTFNDYQSIASNTILLSSYETILNNTGRLNLKADAAVLSNYETIANNNIKQNLQYSKTEVDALLSDLIDNAPAALNTIKELAAALNNDGDYAATTLNLISTKSNVSDVYLRAALDTKFGLKADLAQLGAIIDIRLPIINTSAGTYNIRTSNAVDILKSTRRRISK